jgi:hypothetical protein
VTSEIALPHQKQNELLSQCESVANEHLKKISLIESNFQNINYSQIS